MRRRRERCLLVSATEPDQIRAAFATGADEIVVDLDSVPPARKDDFLRLAIVAAIGAEHQPTAAVQINRRGTRWFDEDIIQIVMAVEFGIDCMVVAGVDCAEDMRAAGELLAEIEAEFPVAEPIGLEARIASAEGMKAIAEVAGASPRLEALVIDVPGESARERGVAAAAAAGLVAVAGPAQAAHAGSFAGAWSAAR